jgi:plastocyanin
VRGLAILAAVALVAVGCGDDGGGSGEASGDVVEVATLDNTFDPETVEVEAGTTVRWDNQGRNAHNVTPVDDDGWGIDTDDFEPGATYEFTFEEEGTYRYYCTIHGTPTSGQIGAVVVGDLSDAVAAGPDADGAGADASTLRVPDDHETIQAAVDAAAPGSMILVEPGVYEEAVTVETDDLVIRGLDRNEVILDGGFELENGVRIVGADGVVVENMTARNYTHNGFFWTGVDGYRGSYLTSYRNGDYGLYAFDSVNGQFDHAYASGSPDAGFYIGQCYPCNAVITDVVAEHNGLGYSGTNSGGNLLIVNSTWRYNRAGIVPNSGDYEEDPPERESTIVGNIVHGNSVGDTPAIDAAITAQGNGILIAGGIDNVVERNLVFDHDLTGIAGVPLPDERIWPATGNRVQDNVVSDSRLADLSVFSAAEDGNCFSDNTFESSIPADIETVLPCDGPPGAFEQDGALLERLVNAEHPPSGDYTTTPVPPDQPSMPDAETAPPRPATDVPMAVDLDAITVPSRPPDED